MTMRVKFITSVVLANGESYAQNQVAELEDTLAQALVNADVVEEMDATVPEGFLFGANGTSSGTKSPGKSASAPGKAKAAAKSAE